MQQPNRNFTSSSYRYGFNGMEKDDELKGQGNSYTSLFRSYDARIGRWFSPDPLMDQFPSFSPYSSYDNNPIYWIDPTGASSEGNGDEDKKKKKKKVNILIGPKDKTWSGDKKDKNTKAGDVDTALVNFVKNAKKESDLIVIEATNLKDALIQIKDVLKDDKEIGNLFIASHGGYKHASFRIGNNGSKGSKFHAWNIKNSKGLKELGTLISGDGNVILMGCHAGSFKNGGDKLVQNLSLVTNANIYGNQSWGWSPSSGLFFEDSWSNFWGLSDDPYYQAGYGKAEDPYMSRKHAYDNAGKWTKATPKLNNGKSTVILETINVVFFRSNGTIGVGDFNWKEIPKNKEKLKEIKDK